MKKILKTGKGSGIYENNAATQNLWKSYKNKEKVAEFIQKNYYETKFGKKF